MNLRRFSFPEIWLISSFNLSLTFVDAVLNSLRTDFNKASRANNLAVLFYQALIRLILVKVVFLPGAYLNIFKKQELIFPNFFFASPFLL